jgi:hypothetical protein
MLLVLRLKQATVKRFAVEVGTVERFQLRLHQIVAVLTSTALQQSHIPYNSMKPIQNTQ